MDAPSIGASQPSSSPTFTSCFVLSLSLAIPQFSDIPFSPLKQSSHLYDVLRHHHDHYHPYRQNLARDISGGRRSSSKIPYAHLGYDRRRRRHTTTSPLDIPHGDMGGHSSESRQRLLPHSPTVYSSPHSQPPTDTSIGLGRRYVG